MMDSLDLEEDILIREILIREVGKLVMEILNLVTETLNLVREMDSFHRNHTYSYRRLL